MSRSHESCASGKTKGHVKRVVCVSRAYTTKEMIETRLSVKSIRFWTLKEIYKNRSTWFAPSYRVRGWLSSPMSIERSFWRENNLLTSLQAESDPKICLFMDEAQVKYRNAILYRFIHEEQKWRTPQPTTSALRRVRNGLHRPYWQDIINVSKLHPSKQ